MDSSKKVSVRIVFARVEKSPIFYLLVYNNIYSHSVFLSCSINCLSEF